MNKSIRHFFCFFFLGLLAAFQQSTVLADVEINNSIADETVIIDTDASHDLIFVGIQNELLVIEVLQFDPNVFDEVPNILQFSEQQLIALAHEHVREEFDVVDYKGLGFYTYGVHDQIYVDPACDLRTLAALGTGDDYFLTGSGKCTAGGKEGDDFIDGRHSRYCTFSGGPGNDTLKGGDFFDGLFGNSGDDVLIGRGGRDYLDGGAGQDVLDGGFDGEIDYLNGSSDDDIYYGRYYKVVTLYYVSPKYYDGRNKTTEDPRKGILSTAFQVEITLEEELGDNLNYTNDTLIEIRVD